METTNLIQDAPGSGYTPLESLWQVVDQFEQNVRSKIFGPGVSDASDILRLASEIAVGVMKNSDGDRDGARGTLSNQLKALLDDPARDYHIVGEIGG